jgi:RNA recognition motif-containing protein
MDIFVGNIPFTSTEDDLRSAFSEHGEVASVKVIKDMETGRSRGFAFVTMPNDSEAQAAIESLNEQEFQGRRIKANESRPRADKPRRG